MKIAESYQADICVIGGGMAGICASVAAARKGAKVVLVQDRPVLGGNASEEMRMWIRGASVSFPLYREGGILEEIAMKNTYYNPTMNYGVWSGVLYDLVRSEKNIRLFLNTSCIGAEEKNGRIESITAWQLTSYKFIKIAAHVFVDCSGDCILSEFTCAKIMQGREDKFAYNEPHAKERADSCTMGNSCLLQARKTEEKVKFIPPSFARKFTDEDFAARMDTSNRMGFLHSNFWWVELGGEDDTLKDAEKINERLLSNIYGVWDYIKNSGKYDSENWDLEWVGFLAGKRESRRYKGEYVLTENDLIKSKEFFDEIAYGGWSMDDHDPRGLNTRESPNRHIYVEKPYAIPYRCIYSENIRNVLFAGRNISVTHMALSSTRVMATCALLGQAAGLAGYLSVKYDCTPKEVGGYIEELQTLLRNDDCYLLRTPRKISDVILQSEYTMSALNFEKLRSGEERKTEKGDFFIRLGKGERVEFAFPSTYCKGVRLVFDNDIARESETDYNLKQFPQRVHIHPEQKRASIPSVLTKEYEVFIKTDGAWQTLKREEDNYLRLHILPVEKIIEGVAFVGYQTYGAKQIGIGSIDIL